MIRVSDYTKAYRTTLAVDGLSFHVEPGQVLGLLGRNGAGKTTTLRAIAGIITPTRGKLHVGGHDLQTDEIAAKSLLAYIPDDPKLFEPLTVWEHLEFTAMAYGVDDLSDRGNALLERFELTEKKDALVQELSRGMRQKVAICCAYLHEPRAILFDEPLTGLDPRGIRTLKESILERAKNGAAVMVSSHLLSLVEDLCTDLLILEKGKAQFFGPISEARRVFAGHSTEASLEEVFFHVTEGVPRRREPEGVAETVLDHERALDFADRQAPEAEDDETFVEDDATVAEEDYTVADDDPTIVDDPHPRREQSP